MDAKDLITREPQGSIATENFSLLHNVEITRDANEANSVVAQGLNIIF